MSLYRQILCILVVCFCFLISKSLADDDWNVTVSCEENEDSSLNMPIGIRIQGLDDLTDEQLEKITVTVLDKKIKVERRDDGNVYLKGGSSWFINILEVSDTIKVTTWNEDDQCSEVVSGSSDTSWFEGDVDYEDNPVAEVKGFVTQPIMIDVDLDGESSSEEENKYLPGENGGLAGATEIQYNIENGSFTPQKINIFIDKVGEKDKVVFKITKSTNYSGICTNANPGGVTASADTKMDFSFSGTDDLMECSALISGTKASANLYCKDFGGSCTIEVFINGITKHKKSIPVDRNNNGLADSWEISTCGAILNIGGATDLETHTGANIAYKGDGFSAFDEYRGFFQADGDHIRTNPETVKDIFFVVDYDDTSSVCIAWLDRAFAYINPKVSAKYHKVKKEQCLQYNSYKNEFTTGYIVECFPQYHTEKTLNLNNHNFSNKQKAISMKYTGDMALGAGGFAETLDYPNVPDRVTVGTGIRLGYNIGATGKGVDINGSSVVYYTHFWDAIVAHEIGHQMGMTHDNSDEDNIMYQYITGASPCKYKNYNLWKDEYVENNWFFGKAIKECRFQ